MWTIAALYHFAPISNTASVKLDLLRVAEAHGVVGTLLLAPEGINGTIAGSRAGLDATLQHIRGIAGFESLEHKESRASDQPFKKLKVRLKKEIVTMGQPHVDPRSEVGNYVSPDEWNDLISKDDVVVIDTRNDYEVAIGTFEGAIDPKTKSFGEFPKWWADNKDRFHNKRVAMFCTGGIRCEKSTNYLLGEGVKDVFHLKGGILKYLEDVPQADSKWNGSCFVFDRRVSVDHGLKEGPHEMCWACRRPVAPMEKQLPSYEEGVQCHQCVDEYTQSDRARFRERHKQSQG